MNTRRIKLFSFIAVFPVILIVSFMLVNCGKSGGSTPSPVASAAVYPRFAYVANSADNTIYIYTVNAATGKLGNAGYAVTGAGPVSITVDPTGRFAYTANAGGDVSAYTIDQTTGALTSGATVSAGMIPQAIAIDPTGRFAYVANRWSGDVSVYTIDQATGALTSGATVTSGTTPQSVIVHPSGKFAYVANEGDNNVSIFSIDQTTGALTSRGTSSFAGTWSRSLVVEPSGKYLYVANLGANTVSAFTIDQTSGVLTDVVSVPTGTGPMSVTVDPSGRFVYVANYGSNDVTQYTINQTTGVLASGATVTAGTNPYSVTVDPSGKFAYVANNGSNNVIVYTIDQTTGALTPAETVVAGTGPASIKILSGSSAGSGSTAILLGGTIQGAPLTALTGSVTTFAGVSSVTGTGTADGTGAAARFNEPTGITTDGRNLYVTDAANNAIRKIVIATRNVTTFAGVASATTGTVDGIGAAAGFSRPLGITTDGTDLYVADSSNYTIRKIAIETGAVSTFAGTAGQQGTTNGTGAAAQFFFPMNITNDSENLYVVDGYGGANAVRKIVKSSGLVSTITTTLVNAEFGSVATDGTNLYLTARDYTGAGQVYKVVLATGELSLVAGHTGVSGAADGTGTAATFWCPTGITTDGTYLYVTDINNSDIRKIEISTGTVSTLSSGGVWAWPRGITSDGNSLFVAQQDYNSISELK